MVVTGNLYKFVQNSRLGLIFQSLVPLTQQPEYGVFIDGNLPMPLVDCAMNGDYLRLDTHGTNGRRLTITNVGEGLWSFDPPYKLYPARPEMICFRGSSFVGERRPLLF